jgi:DNA (cytosine-5)-methyltransferase 1
MLPTPVARDWKDSSGTSDFSQDGRFRKDHLLVAARYWPTPQADDNRDRGNLSMPSIQRRQRLGKQLNLSMVVSPNSGSLNPTWVEWLMGFPLGWTDLGPSATRSSRRSSK